MIKKLHSVHWGWRIVVTLVVLAVSSLFTWLYGAVQSPLLGEAALLQMKDSDAAYVVGTTVMHGLIPQVVGFVLIVFLAFVWVPAIYRAVVTACGSSDK